MTISATRTVAATITDARRVGAKIGTDLRLLHNIYGRPALNQIENYAEEVALLLNDGFLKTVDYGFRDNENVWKLRLRYTATASGQLLDSRPGDLPTTAAVAGLAFYSYLIYSPQFHGLSDLRRANVIAALPIQRPGADEPTVGAGYFTSGHSYGRNGVGVTRDIYLAS
jgi:HORMA domain-containing protein